MYVVNENSNTVSVIDSFTNSVKATINVGSGPFNGNNPVGISYNPYNNNMYVTNFNSNTVSVIDSSTNTVKATINVDSNPFGIAYNPYNHNMYVANENSNTVSVIDSSTNTVKATINVENGPVSVVYNPDNHNMYVTNFNSNTVSVIVPNLSAHPSPGPSPNTTIISVTDDSGNSIENKSSTFSNSITFSVTAIASFNSISGFECSLDGKAYYSCATFNSNNNNHHNNSKNNNNNNSATIKYHDLEAGEEHSFNVRTTDSSGIVDSTPAAFTWIILTPKLAIQNLINPIDRMHLNFAAKTSLESTLYQAQGLVDNHQNIADCNLFNSFIKKVSAFKISGQISDIQALELKQQAASLLKGLGCHSSSTPIQKHNSTNGGNFSYTINKNNLSTKPLKQLLSDTVNNNGNALVSNDGSGNSMSNFNSFFNADGYIR